MAEKLAFLIEPGCGGVSGEHGRHRWLAALVAERGFNPWCSSMNSPETIRTHIFIRGFVQSMGFR